MTKQPRRSRSRVLIVALSASFVLHALLVLHLLRAPPPGPAPQNVPLEILITESIRAPVTPPPPPAAPAPPRARPSRRPAEVAAAPPQLAPEPTPSAEPPPARAPIASDVPMREPALTLRPQLLPATPDTTPEVPLPPEEVAGIQAPPRLSPQEMVNQAVGDAMAEARHERGLVAPYFHDLGQALFAAWHPEQTIQKQVSAQTLASRDGVSVQDSVNSYLKRLEVYGKTGSPLSDMKVGKPPPATGPLDAAPSFAPLVAMSGEISKRVTERRFALVRLTQDRRGRLVDLRLLKPSIHPELDRAALRDFRAAGDTLPVPPEELLGADPTLISLWELELVHGRSTEFRETSTNFAEALALAPGEDSSGPAWFKHLRFAGSR